MTYNSQCPYITDSYEEDHLEFCQLQEGHYGLHQAFGGREQGTWYVKDLIRCPKCHECFEQDDIRYVEKTAYPTVKQKGAR